MNTVFKPCTYRNTYTTTYNDLPISLQLINLVYTHLKQCPEFSSVLDDQCYKSILKYLEYFKYRFRLNAHNQIVDIYQPSFLVDNINVLPFWSYQHIDHECYEITNPAVKLQNFEQPLMSLTSWSDLIEHAIKSYKSGSNNQLLKPITHHELNVIRGRHKDHIEGFETFHNELLPGRFYGSHNSWRYITWHKVLQLKVYLNSNVFLYHLSNNYREDDIELHKYTARKMLTYLHNSRYTVRECLEYSSIIECGFITDNADVLPNDLGISSKEKCNPKVKLRKRLDQDTFIGWDIYFAMMFRTFYEMRKEYVERLVTK